LLKCDLCCWIPLDSSSFVIAASRIIKLLVLGAEPSAVYSDMYLAYDLLEQGRDVIGSITIASEIERAPAEVTDTTEGEAEISERKRQIAAAALQVWIHCEAKIMRQE
jgi:hypothetical protein